MAFPSVHLAYWSPASSSVAAESAAVISVTCITGEIGNVIQIAPGVILKYLVVFCLHLSSRQRKVKSCLYMIRRRMAGG